MNKQQLASKIWESANKMRSKIEANEYKDYILGFIFYKFLSETELMRYMLRLADKDLALDRTMIPLGSCTMKLNAASEMIPVTWAEFGKLHPFAPADQSQG